MNLGLIRCVCLTCIILIGRLILDQKSQLGDICKSCWCGCRSESEGHSMRSSRIHVESLFHATGRSVERIDYKIILLILKYKFF